MCSERTKIYDLQSCRKKSNLSKKLEGFSAFTVWEHKSMKIQVQKELHPRIAKKSSRLHGQKELYLKKCKRKLLLKLPLVQVKFRIQYKVTLPVKVLMGNIICSFSWLTEQKRNLEDLFLVFFLKANPGEERGKCWIYWLRYLVTCEYSSMYRTICLFSLISHKKFNICSLISLIRVSVTALKVSEWNHVLGVYILWSSATSHYSCRPLTTLYWYNWITAPGGRISFHWRKNELL